MMLKVPSTVAAAACNVWIRPNIPSIFGASLVDNLLRHGNITETPCSNDAFHWRENQSYHCDRILVDMEEQNTEEFANVFLSLTRDGIPLGRAKDCPTLSLRTQEDTRRNRKKKHPYTKLAVVGMVVHPAFDDFCREQRHRVGTKSGSNDYDEDAPVLLITRRPLYMRSFPGAFVFPGGNVDPNESLVQAVSREIMEETGVLIEANTNAGESGWKIECLWESVYPTQAPPPSEDTDTEHTKSNHECDEAFIRAHHLVCYFSGRLHSRDYAPNLDLCKEEVDGAVWLSRCDIRRVLEGTERLEQDWEVRKPNNSTDKEESLVAVLGELGNRKVEFHQSKGALEENKNLPAIEKTRKNIPSSTRIPLVDLAGIYPRTEENGRSCGMAQGSLFALEEFARNHNLLS